MRLRHIRVAFCLESGPRFMCPLRLGQLAATTENPQARQQALDEGERLLRAGAVSHNHLWFYHFAMEAALSTRSWASVDRFAAMLEDFTRAEPLPWSDFLIARGRVLAAFGRGRRDAADRKSTRLNSSHLGISYAVFC